MPISLFDEFKIVAAGSQWRACGSRSLSFFLIFVRFEGCLLAVKGIFFKNARSFEIKGSFCAEYLYEWRGI